MVQHIVDPIVTEITECTDIIVVRVESSVNQSTGVDDDDPVSSLKETPQQQKTLSSKIIPDYTI